MTKISLGIIGGGQLGSLLCAEAKNIKINTFVISANLPYVMMLLIQALHLTHLLRKILQIKCILPYI